MKKNTGVSLKKKGLKEKVREINFEEIPPEDLVIIIVLLSLLLFFLLLFRDSPTPVPSQSIETPEIEIEFNSKHRKPKLIQDQPSPHGKQKSPKKPRKK